MKYDPFDAGAREDVITGQNSLLHAQFPGNDAAYRRGNRSRFNCGISHLTIDGVVVEGTPALVCHENLDCEFPELFKALRL